MRYQSDGTYGGTCYDDFLKNRRHSFLDLVSDFIGLAPLGQSLFLHRGNLIASGNDLSCSGAALKRTVIEFDNVLCLEKIGRFFRFCFSPGSKRWTGMNIVRNAFEIPI